MAATAGTMVAGWSAAAYAAAGLTAICTTFTRPVMGSLLPIITHAPRDLVAANVLAGFIEQFGVFAGPLTAGVLMVVWSPTAVFAVAAVTIGAAAAAVLSLDPVDDAAEPPPAVDAGGVVGEVFAGFAALRAHPRLRALIVLGASAGLVNGVGDVIFVTFADARLDGGTGLAGLVASAQGVGAIVGGVLITVLAARYRRSFLVGRLMFVLSGALVFYALAPGVPWLVAASALLGAASSSMFISSSAVIQRDAPDASRGRVMSIMQASMGVSYGVGLLFIGTVADAVNLPVAFLIGSVLLLVGFGLLPRRSPHWRQAFDGNEVLSERPSRHLSLIHISEPTRPY